MLGSPPLPAKLAFEKLERDIREIEKDTAKELLKEMRRVGDEARDVVRASDEEPYRTGALRRSVRTSVRRKSEVSLYSNLPQAPVWEFGGTIRPRGVPINIPKTSFVRGAVVALGDDIDERLAEAFDKVARHHGFF